MEDKKHIVYLGFGCRGFPYGLAEIQRMILISKCLIEAGNFVTVISSRGILKKEDYPDLEASGIFDGINYIYTSGSPFRPDGFLERNMLKLRGSLKEFLLLYKLKKQKRLDIAIFSTHSFFLVFYYSLLSGILHFKTFLNYVEFFSGIKKKWFRAGVWLNDKLYDTYAPKLVDGNLVISEFLIDHLKKIAPNRKYLKIPVLVDYERYKDIEVINTRKYFLFCGATIYKDIITFCIDAFNKLKSGSNELYLVINGPPEDFDEIRDHINGTARREQIKIFSKLTQHELSTFYNNAIGLLIPLRPVIQDIARFPHKIGEYVASGNPVISTDYGEVKYYFHDMQDMLIANRYDSDSFADKMRFVLENPEEARLIGLKAKQFGLDNFDYRSNINRIRDFINLIMKQ